MVRDSRILFLLIFLLTAIASINAQQARRVEMAGLRPDPELHWQRTSPTPQQPDGPVLYQLLFNASGTPGTVPAFDTNPRHLTNSPITINSGNVVIGGGSGITINGTTGIVTFANGQTFPGAGSVSSVTAGNSFITIGGTAVNPTVGLSTTNTDARYLTLTGGTMTGNIVFNAGQTFPAAGLPNLAGEVTGPVGTTVVSNAVSANTANAVVRRDGSGSFAAGNISLTGNLLLPNTGSASVGVVMLGGLPFLHNFGFQDTFVGTSAGNFTTTGFANTAVGTSALASNTTGNSNVAIGNNALQLGTTASSNTAVGVEALHSSTAGGNSAFGSNALQNNTTGTGNAAFGASALTINTTGQLNSAFGYGALQANTSGNNSAFGYTALNSNTTGGSNAAFGALALTFNSMGNYNAAFGASALQNNTASFNAAFGANALSANTTGMNNSALGYGALSGNTAGLNNAAFGYNALARSNATGNSAFGWEALLNNTTGFGNTASGDAALQLNTTGSNNSAFGSGALASLVSGIGNIAVGQFAGNSLNGGENADIEIGNSGVAGESNTIRIGSGQVAAFIAGINGATVATGVAVLVDSNGQLGTTTSSRRFKQDIADLGAESDVLMKLRPVAFYYKPELDSTHTRQYGLVAEEVAQLAPGLVVFDQDGKPQTVRYHFVNAMLLNEVQKQRRLIEAQQQENQEQRQIVAAQQKQIDHLNAALQSQQAAQQEQIAAMQEQMKALMLRLAAVEKSGQQGNKQYSVLSSQYSEKQILPQMNADQR